MDKKLCRHRNTWLIANGMYEWCYECGAIRQMQIEDINSVAPKEKNGKRAKWIRPVGKDGKNPYEKLL